MPPERASRWDRRQITLWSQITGIIILSAILVAHNTFGARPLVPQADQVLTTAAGQIDPPAKPDPFADITLKAHSAFVWDISTHRKLYGKNEYVRHPLASVAKMMTALVASETLAPDTIIRVHASDLREDGDSGLRVGERWRVGELIAFSLVSSSNDAASAIAEAAGAALAGSASSAPRALFVKRMNDKARSIGLLDTTFNNPTGLDVNASTSGAYGTARDMAMLYEYIWRHYPEIFSATALPEVTIKSETGIEHRVKNTNADVARIPGVIGSKTGYTDLAGGNLVLIVDAGVAHPIVIAVLGSTRDDRFRDVEALRSAAARAIASP